MTRNYLGLALAMMLPAGAALADMAGDPAKGEKVFRKCMACHAVGEGAQNKVGPVLNGVVGRAIASVSDFTYSDAMHELAAQDGVWTPEELAQFLAKPRDFVKGTKMSFAGLRKEEERADVIAYLATLK
ncbi:c-type cytochrome [Celeribacter neptunius]|uniref:Cytochrome c n=1 Tax=Celeribacter neptunius TaxID=588602 RepID=A0A1I3W0L0_9RHOB|nr:cytochrome c family protein [Celeribacter neptunius]SFK00733.1 cytochrome c [Celeribacter neptunius]